MGKGPVELAGAGEDGPRLKIAVLDAGDGHDLDEISGREDLIRIEEFLPAQGALVHKDADTAEKLQNAVTRDADEESAIGRRFVNLAVLDHHDVGGGDLADMAERIEHDGVVEGTGARLAEGAG